MNTEKWKDELDSLIEQSMSFAKAVRDESIKVRRGPIFKAVEEVLSERSSSPTQRTFAPMIWPDFGRQEINQCVANFRAHQQKMTREREEFCAQTMANALILQKSRS
jgi:hypothetical protein